MIKYASAFLFMILCAAVLFVSCKTTDHKPEDAERFRVPDTYNFRFVGYDVDIENPSEDDRCYYRIFINKIETGRTSTGLESQKKDFETMLSINRHLLTVEKWVLDKKEGRYVKLNNIDQPKPDYFYFTTVKNRIRVVTLKNFHNGKAEYSTEFEKVLQQNMY